MKTPIKLYPYTAPGSENLTISEETFYEEKDGIMKEMVINVTSPELLPYIPEGGANMPAMIIIPGGAFKRQSLTNEGRATAAWLNSQGFAAFILKTRLPVNDHENKFDVLLMDVQRAVRMVRTHAKEWGICEDRIGVLGFSAGGYQAALSATGFDVKLGKSLDEIDSFSARPDFCVLGYPAISVEEQKKRPGVESHPVAGYEVTQLEKYKPHEMLSENTPPLFIFETDDDMSTPAENSVLMYLTARTKKVPAELHIFKTGRHGFGIGDDNAQNGQWKQLFVKWFQTLS